MSYEWKEWTPPEIITFFAKVHSNEKSQTPKTYLDTFHYLSTNEQMKEFWSWQADVAKKRTASMLFSPFSICSTIRDCTRLPTFPGNLSPKKREQYFKKVRACAFELIELLSDTKFNKVYETELEFEDGNKKDFVKEHLDSWGDDEDDDGRVVAFNVSNFGLSKFDYDYPDSALVQTLYSLIMWTQWDDQWDGNLLASSDPIIHSNTSTARKIYFVCTLHSRLKYRNVKIPFRILATVANVALRLEPSELLDEDTVRKQVRRYEQRMAKVDDRPEAFGNEDT